MLIFTVFNNILVSANSLQHCFTAHGNQLLFSSLLKPLVDDLPKEPAEWRRYANVFISKTEVFLDKPDWFSASKQKKCYLRRKQRKLASFHMSTCWHLEELGKRVKVTYIEIKKKTWLLMQFRCPSGSFDIQCLHFAVVIITMFEVLLNLRTKIGRHVELPQFIHLFDYPSIQIMSQP